MAEGQGRGSLSFPIRAGSGVSVRNALEMTASWQQNIWGRQSVPPVIPPTSWMLPSTVFTCLKKKKSFSRKLGQDKGLIHLKVCCDRFSGEHIAHVEDVAINGTCNHGCHTHAQEGETESASLGDDVQSFLSLRRSVL